MSRVLITGANGFIGGPLCRRFSQYGSMLRKIVRKRGIASTWARPDVEVEEIAVGDYSSSTPWERLLKDVDVVVHLAAHVHRIGKRRGVDTQAYKYVNVEVTKALARAAVRAGVRRMVFLSSAKVNGESTSGSRRFSEHDSPQPRGAYAVSKLEAEKVLFDISHQTGLEVTVLRPPLVYGPGVKANFLALMHIVNSGLPMPLASINNRRSLIYVENLVDAIVASVDRPEANQQIFLVSDGEDFATPALVRAIAKALERPARLFPCPVSALRIFGKAIGWSSAIERLVSSLVVDSSHIHATLGWRPPFSAQAGLEATVSWYKRDRSRNVSYSRMV